MSRRLISGAILVVIAGILSIGPVWAPPSQEEASARSESNDEPPACDVNDPETECPDSSDLPDPNGEPHRSDYSVPANPNDNALELYFSGFEIGGAEVELPDATTGILSWTPAAGDTEFCYVEHSPELYSSYLHYAPLTGYAKIRRFANLAAGVNEDHLQSIVRVHLNWSPDGNAEEEVFTLYPGAGDDVNMLIYGWIYFNSWFYSATVMNDWILIEKQFPTPPGHGMFGIGIHTDDTNLLSTGVALSADDVDGAFCTPRVNPTGK